MMARVRYMSIWQAIWVSISFLERYVFISFVVVFFTYKRFGRAEKWWKAVFEKFFLSKALFGCAKTIWSGLSIGDWVLWTQNIKKKSPQKLLIIPLDHQFFSVQQVFT